MPSIDFYLLKPSQEDPTQRVLMTLCKLVEKAFSAGFTVICRVKDEATAAYLDKLLWTFKDISFIPHGVVGSGEQFPVMIAPGEDFSLPQTEGEKQVLMNASSDPIPAALLNNVSRVCEIVSWDENAKQAARGRYKDYQGQGTFDLRTHEV